MASERVSTGAGSAPESAPEVVHRPNVTSFGIGEDYNFYEPPNAQVPHRSPAPEYQQYPSSPVNSGHYPSSPSHFDSSYHGASPSLSENGSKSRPMSSPVHYSEISSPAPQAAYPYGKPEQNAEKEYYHKAYANTSVAPVSAAAAEAPIQPEDRKRQWYQRWPCIAVIIAVFLIIALAVGLGVGLGMKPGKPAAAGSMHPTPNNTQTNSTDSNGDNVTITGDPEISVGGYLSPKYYSKQGAWNGTGIAIAAANPGSQEVIFAFYQDSYGELQYALMLTDGSWSKIGPINSGTPYKPLNGTALSAVQHQLKDAATNTTVVRWHVFFIDQTYTIRERVLTNSSTKSITPIWQDGPLSALNLKTFQSETIGLQGCYWGNYYGQWSYNTSIASAGIHLWFASSATTFKMYSWTNGTGDWIFDRQFQDLDGHAGVACQTWLSGMTEYVWFVDTKQKIQMYWKDNNSSRNATASHPINDWTPVDIKIDGVHRSSSLGYTNYMLYQAQDRSIRGANVKWAAENTTIVTTDSGARDDWTIQSVTDNSNIPGVGGTHMCITALETKTSGYTLNVLFQQKGDDISMYTRDGKTVGAPWQLARSPIGFNSTS